LSAWAFTARAVIVLGLRGFGLAGTNRAAGGAHGFSPPHDEGASRKARSDAGSVRMVVEPTPRGLPPCGAWSRDGDNRGPDGPAPGLSGSPEPIRRPRSGSSPP